MKIKLWKIKLLLFKLSNRIENFDYNTSFIKDFDLYLVSFKSKNKIL